MAANKVRLTPRQRDLIRHYFECGQVETEAMRRAGYSPKNADRNSAKVFGLPLVQAEIAKKREKIEQKHELSRDWLIERHMKAAMAQERLGKFKKVQKDGSLAWDFTGATEEELALVADLHVDFYMEGKGKNAIRVKKFKISANDALGHLNALARIGGYNNDKVTVTGELSLVERLQQGRKRAAQKE